MVTFKMPNGEEISLSVQGDSSPNEFIDVEKEWGKYTQKLKVQQGNLPSFVQWLSEEKPDLFNPLFDIKQAEKLGFSYNYFDGFIYDHPRGFTFRADEPNIIYFRGLKYQINTVQDFLDLKKKLNVE